MFKNIFPCLSFIFSDDRQCRYKKGKWSTCDLSSEVKVRTLQLKRGPDTCREVKTQSQKCQPRVPAEADKEKSGVKDKENDRKKKRKRKKSKGYNDGE